MSRTQINPQRFSGLKRIIVIDINKGIITASGYSVVHYLYLNYYILFYFNRDNPWTIINHFVSDKEENPNDSYKLHL